MIAEAIADQADAGRINTAEMMDILGLSKSSAHRRVTGQIELTATELRQVIRRCDDREMATYLAQLLLSGSGMIAVRVDDDLDLNGDGVVDTADAMAGAISSMSLLSDLLRQIHEFGETRADAAQLEDAQVALSGTLASLHAVHQVLDILGRMARRRKPARPFAGHNGKGVRA